MTLAFMAAAGVAGFVTGVILLRPSSGVSVVDPTDVRSTSHEVGVASEVNAIEMEWTTPKGAQAYSIDWTANGDDLPDEEADLEGDTTGIRSPPLPDGSWYFHLRTQGQDDDWTSTVHVGPFIIGMSSDGGPTPTPGPTASPAGTGTPTPGTTGSPTPTPLPTITPTSTPLVRCGVEESAPTSGPGHTVRLFYSLLDEGRFDDAYALFTPIMQSSPDFSPFSTWVQGYDDTVSIGPVSVQVEEEGLDSALVSVEVASEIESASGEIVPLRFAGTWTLVASGEGWLLADAIASGEPCTDG
jgi:hypothetical protein